MFSEGRIEEALSSLKGSEDPKTVSMWMALLLSSDRLEEANSFVSSHPAHPTWLSKALYVLILQGQVVEAENRFHQALNEYESLKKLDSLKDSPFGGEGFYEEMCFAMADALFGRIFRFTGRPKSRALLSKDLNEEGRKLCRKAIEYLDRFFEALPPGGIETSYMATLALLNEMKISMLLQNWKRADDAARRLVKIQPIYEEVVRYSVTRGRVFPTEFYTELVTRLSTDHSDEAWAVIGMALIYAIHLDQRDDSWQSLKSAVALVRSPDEKRELANYIMELAPGFDRLEEVGGLIAEIFPANDPWRRFFEAWYLYLERDFERAAQSLLQIENEMATSPPELLASIKHLQGRIAIKAEDWEKARDFLTVASELNRDPIVLRDLVYSLAKLQIEPEVLRVAEEIDSMGFEDWNVVGLIAQAAFNLGQIQKSEAALRRLVQKFPREAKYANDLAQVLILRDRPEEALKIIADFVKDDEANDPECLSTACAIHDQAGRLDPAFELLERCWNRIKNRPSLLLRHVDLGYRTGNEGSANRSLGRLEVLRQAGKVPEQIFRRISLEETRGILLRQKESLAYFREQYRLGRTPRLLLCERLNRPLYLDWAARTQERINLGPEHTEWIDYTTYSTNGMCVEFRKGKGNRLIPISAPKNAEEIVIDGHALITVHRLGLLKRLEKRYKRVFFPTIFKQILASDQIRFGHHQLSKAEVYRQLHKRLQVRDISEAAAPHPENEKEAEKDTFLKRNLRLARLESIPLIDHFAEKEELKEYPDVIVFRFTQLVDALYRMGRLREKEMLNIKALVSEKEEIFQTSPERILKETHGVLIEEMTLEQMEHHGLVQVLLDAGFQITVERATSNYIRTAMLDLEFGNRVGEWNRDLLSCLRKLGNFKEFILPFTSKDRELNASPHIMAAIASTQFAQENGLHLLTDDRWTQMLISRKWKEKTFGTDALLVDLHEKGVLSIEEFSESFLKLCRWRYRFLLPDIRVLVFLAKEFRHNPLGEQLNVLSDYAWDCMKDTGLFLGFEPTHPPLPLGIKFQMEWISRWIGTLIDIWQDSEFTEEQRRQITKRVYRQALPGPPESLSEEIRRKYSTIEEKGVFMDLFVATIHSKNPLALHGLFEETFDNLGYDNERRNAELLYLLRSVNEFIKDIWESEKTKDLSHQQRDDIAKYFARKLIKAFYGNNPPDRLPNILAPILLEMEIGHLESQVENEDRENALQKLADFLSMREELPHYLPDGPLVIRKAKEEKSAELLLLHDLLLSGATRVRSETIRRLLSSPHVSRHTKELIGLRSAYIESSQHQTWYAAAVEVGQVLQKDFQYTRSLFLQVMLLPAPNEQLTNDAWKGLMNPDLLSVLGELAPLINGSLDEENIKRRIERSFLEDVFGMLPKDIESDVPPQTDSFMERALTWYLDNIFFIPVSRPFDFWSLANTYFKFCEPGGIQSAAILEVTRKWLLERPEDPMAYLLALDLVLRARSLSPQEARGLFDGEGFYSLLDGILNALLGTEDTPSASDVAFGKVRFAWKIESSLAHYYLKHIDLEDNGDVAEDMKVVVAWWMAREVTRTLFEASKRLDLKDQLGWLAKMANTINHQLSLIRIPHLFQCYGKTSSILRYSTLHPRPLITVAALSILEPPMAEMPEEGSAFHGLKYPTTTLAPELRDKIIHTLFLQTLLGEGGISGKSVPGIPLHWNGSLCLAAPAFLEAYYGDSIQYIGDEKRQFIEIAKLTTEPDFLDQLLRDISDHPKSERLHWLAIGISLLKVRLLTKGELSEGFQMLKGNETIVKELSELDDDWAKVSLGILMEVLIWLQRASLYESARILAEQFQRIKFEKCQVRNIDVLVPGILNVFLMGGDQRLLEPILLLKNTNKIIRNVLGRFKGCLEIAFPRIPVADRERVRRLLRWLEDIPSPEDQDPEKES